MAFQEVILYRWCTGCKKDHPNTEQFFYRRAKSDPRAERDPLRGPCKKTLRVRNRKYHPKHNKINKERRVEKGDWEGGHKKWYPVKGREYWRRKRHQERSRELGRRQRRKNV